MTTYAGYEYSTSLGAPIECYRFRGTFADYLYTSADAALTVGGVTYQPLAIKRGAISSGTQNDDNINVEIEMPYDAPVALAYAYADSPPDLRLEIYRTHRGADYTTEYELIWVGDVTSFDVSGRTASATVPSIFSAALQGDVPSVHWQSPCNHVLFDARCGLSRAANTTATTVTAFTGTDVSVTDDGVADGELAGGEIINTRTGERRTIVSNVVNQLLVRAPFYDMRVGDAVSLSIGCDHSFARCKAINDPTRYGGHPFVPYDNPFIGAL